MVLVHSHFERLAHALFRQLGVGLDSSLMVVAYPADRPSADAPDELHDKALAVVNRLSEMLTAQRSHATEDAGA